MNCHKSNKSLIIAALGLATLQFSQAAQDYIVQTDLETGVTQHIYVDGPDSVGERGGRVPSAMPVGKSGARFQMYGVGLEPDNKLYLLAETVVGAFMPIANITTWSYDPYEAVTRTRADLPYFAKMDFSNLSADPEAPDSSKRVYVERLVEEYPEDDTRIPIDGSAGLRVVESYYVKDNGELQAVLHTSLKSEFAYKQKGEEIIRVYALPDQNLGWTVIDEKKVQVWPIADGSIKGLLTGSTTPIDLHGATLNEVPSISMAVSDLYPTSQTYLRLFKGSPDDYFFLEEGETTVLPGVITADDYEPIAFNTTVPQSGNQLIAAEQWAEHAKDDGVYTVEIVTRSPFNEGHPERIAYATFTLKRSIKLKGGIFSAE